MTADTVCAACGRTPRPAEPDTDAVPLFIVAVRAVNLNMLSTVENERAIGDRPVLHQLG